MRYAIFRETTIAIWKTCDRYTREKLGRENGAKTRENMAICFPRRPPASPRRLCTTKPFHLEKRIRLVFRRKRTKPFVTVRAPLCDVNNEKKNAYRYGTNSILKNNYLRFLYLIIMINSLCENFMKKKVYEIGS